MTTMQSTSKSPFRHRFIARLRAWCLLALAGTALSGTVSAQVVDAVEIKLGQTISRTWAEVQSDGYAYGPKQEVDATTGETRVWLPYGSKAPYYEVSGLRLTDAAAEKGGTPLMMSIDGQSSGFLTMKFRFDRPVGAFRLRVGWCEWGVKGESVGGVEYSVDGRAWTTIREVNKAGIISTFVSPTEFKAADLRTSDLYIRFYSRNRGDIKGSNYWMKFRMAGDPTWGDASTTFFQQQLQLWVSPAK